MDTLNIVTVVKNDHASLELTINSVFSLAQKLPKVNFLHHIQDGGNADQKIFFMSIIKKMHVRLNFKIMYSHSLDAGIFDAMNKAAIKFNVGFYGGVSLGNKIIIFAVNFNFIPLEVRAFLFDNFMIEEDFEKDRPLKVDYKGMYSELIKYGFEYGLVEYNAAQIKLVHRIEMKLVPRFLMAGHPKNKYDPGKLFSIWQSKLKDKDKRNQEIMNSTMDDFYDSRGEINEKYVLLKDHIKRIQNSEKKYGGK